jgi:cation diffusion facilitator CzcD-associated flavoprotein CzcO
MMADRRFRVVVAGAGVSWLFMAETLKRAGIDCAVYKKAGEVGETWRDNHLSRPPRRCPSDPRRSSAAAAQNIADGRKGVIRSARSNGH